MCILQDWGRILPQENLKITTLISIVCICCYVLFHSSVDQNFSLADPSLQNEDKIPQPSIFIGELKAYQLKGMNWLASLYDQVNIIE